MSRQRPTARAASAVDVAVEQFKALAEPAERVPPTIVASTSHNDGTPPSARNITGTVVTSSSSMMRGLVRPT